MKKFLYVIFAAVILLSGCEKKPSGDELAADKIYFFYSNSCPHCHDALAYINKKYPGLEMSMVNVGNQEGYELLFKCAEKFKLGRNIGTPLFCMGDNYLMGWSDEYEAKFDDYAKAYLK